MRSGMFRATTPAVPPESISGDGCCVGWEREWLHSYLRFRPKQRRISEDVASRCVVARLWLNQGGAYKELNSNQEDLRILLRSTKGGNRRCAFSCDWPRSTDSKFTWRL